MTEFFVVFRNSDDPRWWTRLLAPGFHHCYALSQLHDDIVLGVNPTFAMLEIGLMHGRAIDYARAAHQNDAAVLRVCLGEPAFTKPRQVPIVIASCATTVAYHLGIPLRAITPHRLYRSLIDEYGAEDMSWDS